MNNVQKFYKLEYEKVSTFQKIFNSDFVYVSSMWNKIFKKELLKFLKKEKIITSNNVDLKNLHTIIDPKYLKFNLLSKKKNNNSRPIISDKLFDFSSSQQVIYFDFLRWLYTDVIKKDFYFQRTPTVRVHMPNVRVLSLPAWHSDCFFGHSPRNINVWLGLTDNKKSDFWVKNNADSKKWFSELDYDIEKWSDICFDQNKNFNDSGFYNAEEVSDIYNNIFLFDSRCIHTANYRGEEDNTTRMSIDIRIILVEDYEWKIINNKPVFKGKGIKGAEFRPGHPFGFYEKSVSELIGDNHER